MRSTFIASLLVLAACRHAAPVTAPSPPVVSSDVPGATASDPLGAIRARGGLHGGTYELAQSTGGVSCTLAFTGTAEVAWGAWAACTRGGTTELRSVQHWPVGVKVVTAARGDDGNFYVLVETVATLDRAAGRRSMIALEGDPNNAHDWQASPAPVRVQHRVSEVTDGPSLLRVAGEAAPTGLTEARCNTLRRARTRAALAAAVPAAGIEHFVRYPDGLVLREGHIERAAIARAPMAADLLEVLQNTSGEYCAPDELRLVEEGGALRVAAVLTDAARPDAGPRTGVPRAVTGEGDRAALVAALRARAVGEVRVIASSALSEQGGTVAVVLVESAPRNQVVVVDGNVTRMFELARASTIDDEGPQAVRFIDADGDGRADVVIESSREGVVAHRGLYVTPTASMTSDLRYDLASALVMNTAASLDAAVGALAGVPWRGVTAREACPFVQATRTPAGVLRVASSALRVVNFEEPSAPTWGATYRPLSAFTGEERPGDGSVSCANVRCETDRPVCTGQYDEPGPGSTAYWFSWDGARMKLAGYAVYTGS